MALAVAGCAAASGSLPVEDLRANLMRLDGEIRNVVGEANCTEDRHCAALPLGNKPCGGPAGHIVYSTTGTDVSALHALAERHRETHRALNIQLGARSDCSVVPMPAATCRSGRCAVGDLPAMRRPL